MNKMEPVIIQGGMGVAVSSWQLARAVSQAGQLGVVSGTALDVVLARRLQLGDPQGDFRRAMAHFPIPEMAQRILERYYIVGGKRPDEPFRTIPVPSPTPTAHHLQLQVVASFVEVFLAREGHDGLVGTNLLEKIQLPTLPALYGAMLAGVDYVLMGAGIPRAIPGILDRFADGLPAELPFYVEGAPRDAQHVTRFDPAAFMGAELCPLVRPKFLAIIASATLATMLARKATGHVDGFVVEGPTAGGHNAPPRGKMQLNGRGEPVYGDRDDPDLKAISALGRPFWLAGSFGRPDQVAAALDSGATGVQVGTAFAYCDQSGLGHGLRRRVIEASRAGTLDVMTDPVASPTGFPFKVVQLSDTVSDKGHYEDRHRVCDLGYLRHAYQKPDGQLGWRCGAEDIDAYVRKGGHLEDTCGRKCVCNGLMANIGLGQFRARHGGQERMLVTSGDDVRDVWRYLPSDDAVSYSAEHVIRYLLSEVEAPVALAAAD